MVLRFIFTLFITLNYVIWVRGVLLNKVAEIILKSSMDVQHSTNLKELDEISYVELIIGGVPWSIDDEILYSTIYRRKTLKGILKHIQKNKDDFFIDTIDAVVVKINSIDSVVIRYSEFALEKLKNEKFKQFTPHGYSIVIDLTKQKIINLEMADVVGLCAEIILSIIVWNW